MRKELYLIAVFCVVSSAIFGQQEQLYTQFMYNKLGLNPAFAGNHKEVALSAIVRNQWIGFEGAPMTQSASLNVPLANQKIGFGINLTNSSIGISEKQTIDAMYAYRVNVGSGALSFGLQGSMRRYQVDYSDPRLVGIIDKNTDPTINSTRINDNVINFGAGVYYNTPNFYAGVSAPRLIREDINFSSDIGFSTEVRHFYVMTGGAIDVSNDWVITPQALYKVVKNSPFDIDVNLSATWRSFLTGGLTYRHGGDSESFAESIDLLMAVQVNPGLLIGVSYDFTLSQIRKYSSGSLEATVHYNIGKSRNSEDIINPRYF